MIAAVHSDVLIVGAGSAGSVLAERLSADPGCRVTVLEAGPGPDPRVAALTGDGTRLPLAADSPVIARYSAMLTDDPARPAELVRGATVGGSGAVNGGYFCRGLPRDFDGWALPGWAWPDVLGHFRAIETDHDVAGPLHGRDGPVPVRRTAELTGPAAALAAAAADAGFGWIDDLNGGTDGAGPVDGIGAVPSNILGGHRYGPGEVFLARAAGRPNLSVLPVRRVHRIRFDGLRATGVEATGPDSTTVFTADRIVLSAGAIGSATLLLRSGIGDPDMLQDLGIEPLIEAPVGAAFADHPEWLLPTDWASGGTGPALQAVLGTAEGIEIRPYTQGFAAMTGSGEVPGDRPQIGVALMNPVARGRLRLLSADPRIGPEIRHRYDSAAGDARALANGVALVREILGGTVGLGDPAWATSQHLCGTAPMGGESDPRAVLDERCRVRGAQNLWVIDGSVLPAIPSRGPHASTVMIAHRAAPFVAAG